MYNKSLPLACKIRPDKYFIDHLWEIVKEGNLPTGGIKLVH